MARCGRVKLVSSSLVSILGVIAELRMPTHKGEGTLATHSLTGLSRPMRQFFGVRCGRVKLVSSSLGSILGVINQSINQSINSLITEVSKRTSTCEKHKAVKYT